MKITGFTTILISLSLCVSVVEARDTAYHFPLKDVIKEGKETKKLGDDVRFYFGDQSHPAVEATLIPDVVVTKKTSQYNKTPEEEVRKGCHIAMLAVLQVLQKRVRDEGGNAVVNIEGFFKKNVFRSDDQFECHSGSFLANVTLKGDIVRLK